MNDEHERPHTVPVLKGTTTVASESRADLTTYVAAFARRCAAMVRPGQRVLDQPGVCGVVGTGEVPRGRLLVTDDRAQRVLQAYGHAAPVQIVTVLSPAVRCRHLVTEWPGFHSVDATAMVCPDLAAVPPPVVPDGLMIRPVRRSRDDSIDGVQLEAAARACVQADPMAASQRLEDFLVFLRSLPPATQLFAAVDAAGEVRATAGASVADEDANTYFVSTDAAWRGRGVATAMTSTALLWASARGARRACLDASDAGRSIYRRLGFRDVSPARPFVGFG